MSLSKHIAIIGAGLVGSLLAIYLSKRGYQVSVYERRPDLRHRILDAGRSINLALSNRGIRALEDASAVDAVRQIAIPMHGRMMHAIDGTLSFLPYGKEGEYINSISRSALNISLINIAEEQGTSFFFDSKVSNVDLLRTTLSIENETRSSKQFDGIVGADGAFSAVRLAMQLTDRFDFSQDYIEHGYKELHIPAGDAGTFKLEKNALHIWPRENFMMIALPNIDGSFTCTLFFPFEGPVSFNTITTDEEVLQFFKSTFGDAFGFMPTLVNDFKANPTSSLVTMKCYPWMRNKTLLLGDAAHAIVPFYGQGMNAGFEDVRILNALLDEYNDQWEEAGAVFQRQRKPNTEAIAKLALDNFVEMRDLVADADFLLRKKIEAKIHSQYPDKWIPLYSMVTFHDDIPYAKAMLMGQKQKKIMDEVMKMPNIETTWPALNFERLALQVQEA
jgi:kynurenine 3-monooxygenase